jgi:hypothetical protein
LRHGRPVAAGLPPRFLVCAALYAIEAGAETTRLHRTMLELLAPGETVTAATAVKSQSIATAALAA